jgi:hypothetical protein
MKGKFNIKNYTTDVPAERSISEIERILASFGASATVKEYADDGKVFSLMFRIEKDSFKLPANVSGVKDLLFKGKSGQHRSDYKKAREDKAYRVSWRIIKDWIHAQLSLIASGQANPHEVFFPYMYDGKKTLYQTFMANRLLTEKAEAKEE